MIPGVCRFIVASIITWNVYPPTNQPSHGSSEETDAKLITALRNAAPALLAAARRVAELERDNARLRILFGGALLRLQALGEHSFDLDRSSEAEGGGR